jgi:hypothetical protein
MHSRLAGIIDLPDIEAGTHIAGWLKRGCERILSRPLRLRKT